MTKQEREELLREILALSPEKPHGRYLLAPRFGKTRFAIELMKQNKPKSVLWVTPLAELAEIDIPKEFEVWKAKSYLKKLTTVTWTSLKKMKGHFDMIILDEEQFATENNLSSMFKGDLSYDYIVSMTGTETKHEDKQELYNRLNLKVLYEMDINDAVDFGILSNYQIKVVEVSLGTEKNIPAGSKEKPFLTSEEKQYEYLNKMFKQAMFQKRKDMPFRMLKRMRAIYDSPTKENVADWLMKNLTGRKLFFCSSSKQADKLCEYTYHNKTTGVHFKQFVNGEIDEIAMVHKGGTGATYKAIDHLVLVQADSDKNGLTSQKISRTLLKQEDYQATIWIICLLGTQDEKWIEAALERFDKTKVEFIRFKNLENKTIQLSEKESDNLDMFKKAGVESIQMGSKTYKL